MTLKLPYISEEVSCEIRKFINSKKLPIKVIFKPGTKLKEIFCSSRPHDKQICPSANCKICPNLPEGCNCQVQCPIYRITCEICGERYIGESSRSIHDRLSEHLRFATSPLTPSYKDEAMAIHYQDKHSEVKPELKFELLRTETNTVLRKIYEAYYIYNQTPEINDKSEVKLLLRFLVTGDINV